MTVGRPRLRGGSREAASGARVVFVFSVAEVISKSTIRSPQHYPSPANSPSGVGARIVGKLSTEMAAHRDKGGDRHRKGDISVSSQPDTVDAATEAPSRRWFCTCRVRTPADQAERDEDGSRWCGAGRAVFLDRRWGLLDNNVFHPVDRGHLLNRRIGEDFRAVAGGSKGLA